MSSTPNKTSQPLTAQQRAALWTSSPEDYPCFKDGVYAGTSGCRKRCCIVPAIDDEDPSPKWSARVAAEMAGQSPIAQPNFGMPVVEQTPPKTVLPDGYDASTGLTPLDAEGWQVAHVRANCDRPNIPGHTAEGVPGPFCLATPTRAKAAEE